MGQYWTLRGCCKCIISMRQLCLKKGLAYIRRAVNAWLNALDESRLKKPQRTCRIFVCVSNDGPVLVEVGVMGLAFPAVAEELIR